MEIPFPSLPFCKLERNKSNMKIKKNQLVQINKYVSEGW